MLEEASNQLRTMLQPAKFPPRQRPQLRNRVREGIGQRALDDRVALLLGIQLRRVGRQPHDGEILGMGGQKGLHLFGSVRTQAIPDQQQRCPELPPQVTQHRDDHGTIDRPQDMSSIQPAIGNDRDEAGHLAPPAPAPEYRHLTHRRPRGAYAGPKRVTCFVQAGKRAPLAVSSFFRAGQSRFSQAATTASSRSFARGAGRWALQPYACNGRSR